jgi:hypothetical protein
LQSDNTTALTRRKRNLKIARKTLTTFKIADDSLPSFNIYNNAVNNDKQQRKGKAGDKQAAEIW